MILRQRKYNRCSVDEEKDIYRRAVQNIASVLLTLNVSKTSLGETVPNFLSGVRIVTDTHRREEQFQKVQYFLIRTDKRENGEVK